MDIRNADIANLVADRLRVNKLALKVPAWVALAVARLNEVPRHLRWPPSFAECAAVLAFGLTLATPDAEAPPVAVAEPAAPVEAAYETILDKARFDVWLQKLKDAELFAFDTETTGLPKRWDAPITDSDNWPRCIQIAWQLHDEMGQLIEHQDYLVKPEGFNIPYDAERIHGISTELAQQNGVALTEVLEKFNNALF